MAISCAYCGGSHGSPADVKRCWRDRGEPADDAAPTDAGVPPSPEPSPRRVLPSAPSAGATPFEPIVGAGPGPDALGRHAVVRPGQAVPAPWHDAPRVTVGAPAIEAPIDTVTRIRRAAHERRRLVLELAVPFDDPPTATSTEPPHTLGADFAFDVDELHHLLWSNSVDLREPDRPTMRLIDAAVAAGASIDRTGSADVVTPSGRRVWLDGGPVRYTPAIDGTPVLHGAAVERGSFEPATSNDSAADLAPDQLAAVTHDGGGARIIAPAGSGKTRVLTERARHLLRAWNLPPGAVTLLAFNKRAQGEMVARTPDLPGLQVRTINSIALAIVNGTTPFAPQRRSVRTIDEVDVRRILGDLVAFPRKRNSDPVAPWIEALGLIRLGLVDPEEAEARYDGEVDGLGQVWPRFERWLDDRNLVDFDHQIHRALTILLGDPAARRAAQRSCRVMLVDEFQDLTPAHLLLIRLLAAPGGEVFGVGDDDQTIYGYNGADPAWLIDFDRWFPGSGEHPLEVNYRCPGGVVEAVDRLLRHNRRRVPKAMRAASPEPGGWTVDASVDAVGATVAAVMAALEHATPADVAVLTRVNALLAPVQVALGSAGVPVEGGVGLEFVDRTAVRSVLAWLRVACARSSFRPDDLREALRRPSRSFHPRIGDWIAEQGDVVALNKLAGRLNNERDADRVFEFAADIRTLQQLVAGGATTSDVVLAMIDEIGLGGSVATLDVHRRGMNRSAQSDDLTAITHLAALHDDPTTFESWLRTRLTVKRSAPGVTLATVHRVKGQEWPHVVVHLVDRHQYPHRLADDVEEERRLFHVAITRASRHATIVTGAHPSPFVDELTEEPSSERVVRSHAPVGPRAAAPTASDPAAGLDAAASARFDALRELRNRLRDGKPAYVVFDNKTLASIAASAPTTTVELARIPGVGPAKLERFGEAVVTLMRAMVEP
jgi:DNA helicase-2/ATP-dependent DNA helicase PcrA